ncbi:MAG: hypothetical protein GY948_17010 [Alphaproteobacteria bacterium]|nr:hypothetical protein [Alphaproteobacteria bacterium]
MIRSQQRRQQLADDIRSTLQEPETNLEPTPVSVRPRRVQVLWALTGMALFLLIPFGFLFFMMN